MHSANSSQKAPKATQEEWFCQVTRETNFHDFLNLLYQFFSFYLEEQALPVAHSLFDFKQHFTNTDPFAMLARLLPIYRYYQYFDFN